MMEALGKRLECHIRNERPAKRYGEEQDQRNELFFIDIVTLNYTCFFEWS